MHKNNLIHHNLRAVGNVVTVSVLVVGSAVTVSVLLITTGAGPPAANPGCTIWGFSSIITS